MRMTRCAAVATVQVVGGDDERRAGAPLQVGDQAQHILTVARIEVAGGLIHDHDVSRLGGQSPGNRHPLAARRSDISLGR